VDSMVLDIHPMKPWNQDSFNGLWLLGCAGTKYQLLENHILSYTICKYI
jgi:hypothetical protein